jgi:hypothetical protein
MLRRAFLKLLPAALLPAVIAFAFLAGVPYASAAATETRTASFHAGSSIDVRESLTRDILDAALIQRADEDDTPDDRIIRPSTRILWETSALNGRSCGAPQTDRPSHRPCAARSRAPPAA